MRGIDISTLRRFASIDAGRPFSDHAQLGTMVRAAAGRDADGIVHIKGDLERFVTNFTANAPQRNNPAVQLPNAQERTDALLGWKLMRSGDLPEAVAAAERANLNIIRFTDIHGGGATHHVLLEAPNLDGQRARGLGMYFARTDAPTNAPHIQVPHPWDDIATDAIGAGVFRSTDAETLAVAGASRHSLDQAASDAAHSRGTLFHSITNSTAREGTRHLQLHGFRESKHPGYGKAVVSSGAEPTDDARALHRALRDADIDARLAGVPGKRPYANLAGRNNVQGRDAREKNAVWTHVELGNSLRLKAENVGPTVRALSEGLAPK